MTATPPEHLTDVPGWKGDPAGRFPGRYWDGQRWTDRVNTGTEEAVDAPGATFAAPSFSARSAGNGVSRKKRGGSTVLKVALGVVLGLVLLIGGCAVLIGGAANEVQKDQEKHAITRTQYRSVHPGDSKSDVKAAFGVEPSDGQEFESEGLDSSSVKSSCDYYNEKDRDLGEGSYFQLCYDDEKLTSKNAY